MQNVMFDVKGLSPKGLVIHPTRATSTAPKPAPTTQTTHKPASVQSFDINPAYVGTPTVTGLQRPQRASPPQRSQLLIQMLDAQMHAALTQPAQEQNPKLICIARQTYELTPHTADAHFWVALEYYHNGTIGFKVRDQYQVGSQPTRQQVQYFYPQESAAQTTLPFSAADGLMQFVQQSKANPEDQGLCAQAARHLQIGFRFPDALTHPSLYRLYQNTLFIDMEPEKAALTKHPLQYGIGDIDRPSPANLIRRLLFETPVDTSTIADIFVHYTQQNGTSIHLLSMRTMIESAPAAIALPLVFEINSRLSPSKGLYDPYFINHFDVRDFSQELILNPEAMTTLLEQPSWEIALPSTRLSKSIAALSNAERRALLSKWQRVLGHQAYASLLKLLSPHIVEILAVQDPKYFVDGYTTCQWSTSIMIRAWMASFTAGDESFTRLLEALKDEALSTDTTFWTTVLQRSLLNLGFKKNQVESLLDSYVQTETCGPHTMPFYGLDLTRWGQQCVRQMVKADRPHPNDVDQGSVGNCWIMAGLSATAEQCPETISQAIRIMPAGVSVRLFDSTGQPHWIDVSLSEIYRHALADTTPNQGKEKLWVAAIEIATEKFARQQTVDGRLTTASGGNPTTFYKLWHGPKTAKTLYPNQTTAIDLQLRFQLGESITLGSKADFISNAPTTSLTKIATPFIPERPQHDPYQHGFSVHAIKTGPDGRVLALIRDPKGSNDLAKDPYHWIQLQDFINTHMMFASVTTLKPAQKAQQHDSSSQPSNPVPQINSKAVPTNSMRR